MATLLEALSNGTYDLQTKKDLSSNFGRKLFQYRDTIVSDYLKHKISLNTSIAKIAERDSLNDDQIQRIIEECNNQVYLVEYGRMKNQPEREVEFDIAELRKVKAILKGDKNENSEGDEKKDSSIKVAFETTKLSDESLEKIASSETYDVFSGLLSHSFGSLGTAINTSESDIAIKKIASTISDKRNELEKLAKDMNTNADMIGAVLIESERLGYNSVDILSKVAREANLTEKELLFVKEAADKRISYLKEVNVLPESFNIDFEKISYEKTASEKFSLGEFSLRSSANDIAVPNMCVENTYIKSMSDICKIAKEIRQNADDLFAKNDEYITIMEKCAENGITDEFLYDNHFFQ